MAGGKENETGQAEKVQQPVAQACGGMADDT